MAPTTGVCVELHCLVNGVSKLVAESDTVIMPADRAVQPPSRSPTKGNKKATGSKASVASRSSKIDTTPSQVSLNEHDGGISLQSSQPASTAGSSVTLTEFGPDPSVAVTSLIEGLSAVDLRAASESLINCQQSLGLPQPAVPLTTSMALSSAALKSANLLCKEPAVNCLMRQYGQEETWPRSLPFLIVPVISGGSLANGKLKWKYFSLLLHASQPIEQVVKIVNSMYHSISTVLTDKYGPSAAALLPTVGTFAPNLDKPEQAMEILQNAAALSGYELGSDLEVCITISANDLYDQEKNKYELIAGQWKAPSDIVTLLSDFIRTWPSVKMLVDPLQKNAHSDWQELRQRIGENCVLVGEDILSPFQPETKDNSTADLDSSGKALTLSSQIDQKESLSLQEAYIKQLHEWMINAVDTIIWPYDLVISPTLHHLMVNLLQAASVADTSCLMFSYTGQPMDSELYIDVAVAASCQYLQLPLPCVKPKLYQHLLSLQTHLQQQGLLDEGPASHHFWRPPPPTPEPEEEDASRAVNGQEEDEGEAATGD